MRGWIDEGTGHGPDCAWLTNHVLQESCPYLPSILVMAVLDSVELQIRLCLARLMPQA
jgi:hypothetical protein